MDIQNLNVDPVKSFNWLDLNWIRSLNYGWTFNRSDLHVGGKTLGAGERHLSNLGQSLYNRKPSIKP